MGLPRDQKEPVCICFHPIFLLPHRSNLEEYGNSHEEITQVEENTVSKNKPISQKEMFDLVTENSDATTLI